MDEQTAEILSLAADVEKFLSSPLGRIMTLRMENQMSDALTALSTVDPSDTREIMRLQNIVANGNNFTIWLKELVIAGDNAYKNYTSGVE